jgi:hypothetical protein
MHNSLKGRLHGKRIDVQDSVDGLASAGAHWLRNPSQLQPGSRLGPTAIRLQRRRAEPLPSLLPSTEMTGFGTKYDWFGFRYRWIFRRGRSGKHGASFGAERPIHWQGTPRAGGRITKWCFGTTKKIPCGLTNYPRSPRRQPAGSRIVSCQPASCGIEPLPHRFGQKEEGDS